VIARTAALSRTASYSSLRTFLMIRTPIFHATTARQLLKGLRTGFAPEGGFFEMNGERGLPLTRNLDLLLSNPYGRPYIVVFDRDALLTRVSLEESEVPDDVGDYLTILRSGILHPSMIRGLVVKDRVFMMRNQMMSLAGPSASPVRRAPTPTTVI
jgi:hypothetical protein